MEADEQGRSARKRQSITQAATRAFMEKGYCGTSMDDIAKLAAVSKQTVYRHFSDKEKLFAEIVLGTTDHLGRAIDPVSDIPSDADALEENLTGLARCLLTTLTRSEALQLGRLVIASAGPFPALATAWYEQSFERVLMALTTTFRRLTEEGVLRIDEPLLAAHHFSGLLLWVPVNETMFRSAHQHTPADLERYATAGVRAFLAAYR
ncbi:TetR/AcrR family transcriptional regulator [Streptomyces sp. NPDC058195]|uniref:TetR/AcrR family transcriptional regulator n=1 Tax=Streptomyces sp. NPDC058195 TaxID=3346375 RepID=UPI0036E22DAD